MRLMVFIQWRLHFIRHRTAHFYLSFHRHGRVLNIRSLFKNTESLKKKQRRRRRRQNTESMYELQELLRLQVSRVGIYEFLKKVFLCERQIVLRILDHGLCRCLVALT